MGVQLAADGTVSDAIVGSPAFEAGISSGMKLVGVNGRVYTHDLLEDAIREAKDGAAKGTSQPITLLVVVDDYYQTSTIHYTGGDRYPHLAREDGKDDYLDEMIKAHVGGR
jgi:predicted metalloprotease with PDZ domain